MMVSSSLQEEVEIPEGVEVKLEGKTVEVSGPRGKLSRTFDMPGVGLRRKESRILIETSFPRRRHRAAVGTIKSHLCNMVKAVTEGFTYRLKVVYSHFPITVKVEGRRVMIHNFLGEKNPRMARIVGDASVQVKGDEIIVEGINKEEVGQTATNIEQASRVKHRDPRVFQDGIFLVAQE